MSGAGAMAIRSPAAVRTRTEKRDLILDAAVKVFARRGYHGSRVSDIAREAPFEFGASRLEGELRRARGTTAIRGTLHAEEIDALGQRTSVSGPVQAALSRERFVLSGDLRTPGEAPPLFARARINTALEYDRERERFQHEREVLERPRRLGAGRDDHDVASFSRRQR